MIQEFVDIFMANKADLETEFKKSHPSYADIVTSVIKLIHDNQGDLYPVPDPERVHKIDDGHYQGTVVYVIGGTGYQPRDYWYVMVYYGSCSGCDTLEAIRDYTDEVTDSQVADYMTLALHILQGIKAMGDE